MRLFRPLTAALLALALLCLPVGAAAAAEIVPPGNSAASQYTEAFPTTGGERETEHGKKGKAVPAKALGARNAKQLESKGKDGRAVAEFAAETAPAPAVTETSPPADAPRSDSGDGSGDGESDAAAGGGKGGNGGGGGDGKAAPVGEGVGEPSSRAVVAATTVEEPSGSSGVGEVLGEATGSSSGKLGLLLPLVVIGAIVWSLFYLWRQRQQKQRVA